MEKNGLSNAGKKRDPRIKSRRIATDFTLYFASPIRIFCKVLLFRHRLSPTAKVAMETKNLNPVNYFGIIFKIYLHLISMNDQVNNLHSSTLDRTRRIQASERYLTSPQN